MLSEKCVLAHSLGWGSPAHADRGWTLFFLQVTKVELVILKSGQRPNEPPAPLSASDLSTDSVPTFILVEEFPCSQ